VRQGEAIQRALDRPCELFEGPVVAGKGPIHPLAGLTSVQFHPPVSN